MTIVPKVFDRVRQVIVFHHGAGEHVGCHYQNELLTFAHLHGAACIGFDMLGHGRSDGLHMMVESWDSYVDWAVAFNDTFVPPKVTIQHRDNTTTPFNTTTSTGVLVTKH
jgi:alpha-beta hydrolase superfamily lysophospholipase